MKLTQKMYLALIVVGLLVSGSSVIAKPTKSKKDQEIVEQLQKGLPVHMPLRAAAIVSEAPAAERSAVAVQVINQAVALRPQLAPAFVSAIVRVAPETSQDVVAAASKAQPSLSREITAAVPTTVTPVAAASSGTVAAASITKGSAFKATARDEAPDSVPAPGGSPEDSKTGKAVNFTPRPTVVDPPSQGPEKVILIQRGGKFGTKVP